MSIDINHYHQYCNQKSLVDDNKANMGRPYQQCALSVMDTIADPFIQFDEQGVSHYYSEYLNAEENFVLKGKEGKNKFNADFDKIKLARKGNKYDCILGLSGGVDSSYLCLLAKEKGLNPLVVHFDNGWNSELAQHNIENIVKTLNFDLFTYVVNWNHFKEFQLSYLKASVVDIEVLTDHAFMAVLYEQARKWKIKYVLAGMNIVTEQVLPSFWVYNKGDQKNIKDIQKKHGRMKLNELSSFPFLSANTKNYCIKVLGLEMITPLNYIDFVYNNVKSKIKEELNWRDYGGKHYESVWTRFYQGYILPRKFNIDKRKAHLSNLIFSGQMKKEEALLELKKPPYPSFEKLREDYDYVLKKFKLNHESFQALMDLPRIEHQTFETQKSFWDTYPYLKPLRSIRNAFRK